MRQVLLELIENVRAELNDLIASDASYERIYRVSIELDQLINEYYNLKKKSA